MSRCTPRVVFYGPMGANPETADIFTPCCAALQWCCRIMARNIFDGGAAVAANKHLVLRLQTEAPKAPSQPCLGFGDRPCRVVTPPSRNSIFGPALGRHGMFHMFIPSTTRVLPPRRPHNKSIEKWWLDGVGGGGTSHAVTLGVWVPRMKPSAHLPPPSSRQKCANCVVSPKSTSKSRRGELIEIMWAYCHDQEQRGFS